MRQSNIVNLSQEMFIRKTFSDLINVRICSQHFLIAANQFCHFKFNVEAS